jgi:hypothetical protein
MTEVRCQRSDVRDQMTEIRGQMTDYRYENLINSFQIPDVFPLSAVVCPLFSVVCQLSSEAFEPRTLNL